MKNLHLGPNRLALMAALVAAVLVFGTRSRAADTGFPIYFDNNKLIVKAETVNRTTYLPLLDIVQFMRLTYTDATTLETFTIRNGNSRLVLTKNSALISINDQIVLLRSEILHENNRWMVPVDFLTQGLSKLTGTTFRYRSGSSRIFVGNVASPEVMMNAQTLGPVTRLTIRTGTASKIAVNRTDSKHAVIQFDRGPLDPLREQVDHRDRLVHSVNYDDSDGVPKIVVETTDEVADIHVTPAEGNEVFFVDFTRRGAAVPPEPAAEPAAAPRADVPSAPSERKLRVVVLDPGHGGLDMGTKGPSIVEKDLTLTIARKLRTTLQARLGVTVLLTRDADVLMDNEARSAVANNNQANLFISLHIGYSPNRDDTGSSVFVMKEDFGGPVATASSTPSRMFLPWYLGYRASEARSIQVANLMQDELSKINPGWKFPVRRAPLGVLSSTTMPAIALEIGNLNNSASAQTLLDDAFQNRLAEAIASAVLRFAEGQTVATGN